MTKRFWMQTSAICMTALIVLSFAACPMPVTTTTYAVMYDGNGSTGGAVPVDANRYKVGDSVAVASAGTLVKSGCAFSGWNTRADGGGTGYAAGSTFMMGGADVRLYARWTTAVTPKYTVTYDGNGGTGGTVPSDTNTYASGTTVTVSASTTLRRDEYALAGWNTAADGSGTAYAEGASLTMGGADIRLYAKWTAGTTGLSYTSGASGWSASKGTADTNGTVVVPDYHAGQPVVGVANEAFLNCAGMTTIVLSRFLVTIGDSAFYGCSELVSANLPSGLASIGTEAFRECSKLASITLPSSVTSIGDAAFYSCHALTSVTIPNGVTELATVLFEDCPELVTVVLPSGLAAIGIEAFAACGKLENVSIPSGVTSIGESAFNGCSGLKTVTVPSGVTILAAGVFNDCSGLTSVTLPSGLLSIGTCAFYGCTELPNVTIPSTVTSIGNSAFYLCTSITSLALPSGLATIGSYAFSRSGLTSLSIPAGVSSVGQRAFSQCYGLDSKAIYVNPTTPPSAGGALFESFTIGSILVPSGSVAAYQAAAGWGDYSAFIAAQP